MIHTYYVTIFLIKIPCYQIYDRTFENTWKNNGDKKKTLVIPPSLPSPKYLMPGVLQFMGSQRVGHDWATELNWTEHLLI